MLVHNHFTIRFLLALFIIAEKNVFFYCTQSTIVSCAKGVFHNCENLQARNNFCSFSSEVKEVKRFWSSFFICAIYWCLIAFCSSNFVFKCLSSAASVTFSCNSIHMWHNFFYPKQTKFCKITRKKNVNCLQFFCFCLIKHFIAVGTAVCWF